jgi:hypothetical protein
MGCANLRGASLARADLSGAILYGDRIMLGGWERFVSSAFALSSPELTRTIAGANLRGVEFTGAKLLHTDLRCCNLVGAIFRDVDLSEADFRGSYLRFTQFNKASLKHADFADAILDGCIFIDVDLSQTKSLESCVHQGPSTLDYGTLSHDLPIQFLRGCGIADQGPRIIATGPVVNAGCVSCFISYSTKDQDFADRLYADLQANGVRCWFAPHDIRGGRKIHEQIEEAIRVYDKLLLILSDASMNSNWVKTEIANARAHERQQNGQMLFPITLVSYDRIKSWKLFDADSGIDSAREIREYYVPDFSGWKDHDSYQQTFERLVRDLKASGDTPKPAKEGHLKPANGDGSGH